MPEHDKHHVGIPPLAHAYGTGTPLTLGIEEEFMLLHPTTFELVPAFGEVAKQLRARGGQVDAEMTQSVLEGVTPVCADIAEAEQQVLHLRRSFAEAAAAAGCCIAAAGTHPFCWTDLEQVTDGARYREIMDDFPWVAKESVTYGMHVHVGMPSAEDALRVMAGLKPILAHFVALAANSPFWKGEETGLRSVRLPLAGLYPRSGLPPRLDSWSEYEHMVWALRDDNDEQPDPTKIWWLIRPQPRFGTVEVRIFDTQTEPAEALALVALTQAACAHVLAGGDFGAVPGAAFAPDTVYEDNIWHALRGGMDATLANVTTGERAPAHASVDLLLAVLAPVMVELGSSHAVATLQRMARSNGASRQLSTYSDTGNFSAVLQDLVERTEPLAAARAAEVRGSRAGAHLTPDALTSTNS